MSDLTSLEQQFRMANPVPDPADPPMTSHTAATALLELDERRAAMQTQETETFEASPKPTGTPPRRRLLIAGVAFAVVLAAVIGAVALFDGEDPGSDVVDTPAPAPQTGPPTITFDEASMTCEYTGPATFKANEQATFAVVNDSALELWVAVAALKPGLTVGDLDDGLRDPRKIETGPGDQINFPEDAANPTIDRVGIGVLEGTVEDTTGTWIVTCGSPFGAEPEFESLAGSFEVVP